MSALVNNNIGWIDFRVQLAGLTSIVRRGAENEMKSGSFDLERDALRSELPVELAPTDDPAMLGRLGRYEVVGVIGHGSMGIVFKAFDGSLNRFVAIKMLAAGFVHNSAARQRFEREGQAIAAVRDPHVIEIYGVEEFNRIPFIIMRYVPGGSLQRCLDRNGPMSVTTICRIGMQIAKGLNAAHRQGIIHRDIKPANILLEDGNQIAIVSDFGLARVGDEATMTRTGVIAGTPQFMSPEQARGQSLDFRSDLFSLGCVLYSLCVGHSPFRAETLMGVVHRVCEVTPKPIGELNPEIPDWLVEFIEILLNKKKEERIQTAAHAVTVLEGELAYLHSPLTIPRPERDWSNRGLCEKQSRWSLLKRWGIATSVLAIGLLVAVISFSLLGTGTTNRWGVIPTVQEEQFISARTAYELAYETHLSEVSLRGDMAESIQRHKEAFELGFDPPQTAFNLARAYAYQGSIEIAFQWLEDSLRHGFHDRDAIAAEPELSNLRKDMRYTLLLNRATDIDRRFQIADEAYFANQDYPKAESLYRQLLRDCPNDEFCVMMIGASLLEQGKYTEAKPWCEKTRKSVRLANFGNYNLGCIAAQKGDFDRAFLFLNHAIDTGFTDVNHLKADHQLKPLRGLPRFNRLVERMVP
ncbi:MAG: protein kinase [Planctomycetota bacterium]